MIMYLIIMGCVLIAVVIFAVVSMMDEPLTRFRNASSNKPPQEHLFFVVKYMRMHELTLEQLAPLWNAPDSTPSVPVKPAKGDMISSVMYFLGAVLVFAGVGIYICSFWYTMSSLMRIFVTLGVGMGLSALSAIAMKEGKYEKAILPLVLVAALIQCGGWFVFLHEMFPHSDDVRKASLFCFGMMAFQQGMMFQNFRRTSLIFTVTVFVYGALQATLDLSGLSQESIALLLGGSLFFTAHVLERTPYRKLCGLFYAVSCAWFNTGMFLTLERSISDAMAAIVTGLSVLSFGAAMGHAGRPKMAGLAYFIGSGMAYGGLFEKVCHTSFEVTYFAVAIAMMYVSAMVKSRALLATSVLAILGFIGYYTQEHFLNSAGWPIALMIMGIAFLGVGTMAVRIKRRYVM